jgi:hypothetical protein
MHPQDEALWDDLQLAEFLKLSPGTLRKARMVGSGPPFLKFGHSVRYVPSSVREWCAQRTQRSTSENAPPLTPEHPHRGPGRPRQDRNPTP